MALTLSGTNGIVGAGFTLDASGASVTAGVGTFGSLNAPAAGLTGALPAISAASLTKIPAANIVGVCTSGLTKTGGFGKLLSVNEAVKLDTASQGSATFAAISGLQPTVTPTSTTSKVLVMINLKIGVSHDYADMCLKLFRSVGGTETQIFSGSDDGDRSTGFFGQQDTSGGVGVYVNVPVSAQFLDSPNTTSEVTYIVKWRVQRSSTYIYLNRCGTDGDDVGNHRNSSSITLMEIAP